MKNIWLKEIRLAATAQTQLKISNEINANSKAIFNQEIMYNICIS